MESIDTIIISTYEMAKSELDAREVICKDRIWEEFIKRLQRWPSQKEDLLDFSAGRLMAGISASGLRSPRGRNNFKTFFMSKANVNCNKLLDSGAGVDHILSIDPAVFHEAALQQSVDGIVALAVQFGAYKAKAGLEVLPYIDILYQVLCDRMLYYPNYNSQCRPLALTKRFFNSIFREWFTTLTEETQLNMTAAELDIAVTKSYVEKQMLIRKRTDECLNEYAPQETSYFIRASLAHWLSNTNEQNITKMAK